MTDGEFTEVLSPEDAQAVASSVIPYNDDDNRAVYLSYRACGLSIDEALIQAGISKSALHKWRAEDAEFKSLEVRLPELRSKLAAQRLNIEFLRNLMLLFRRDSHIINKALLVDNWQAVLMRQVANEEISAKDAKDRALFLTKQEQQYLLKIRAQYTADQYETLRTLLTEQSNEKLTWADLATRVQANRGKVKMTRTDTVVIEEGTDAQEEHDHTES